MERAVIETDKAIEMKNIFRPYCFQTIEWKQRPIVLSRTILGEPNHSHDRLYPSSIVASPLLQQTW